MIFESFQCGLSDFMCQSDIKTDYRCGKRNLNEDFNLNILWYNSINFSFTFVNNLKRLVNTKIDSICIVLTKSKIYP